jgi:hypothetical protein
VFCRNLCRYRYRGESSKLQLADPEQIARLFDESRDPNERVREDDWFPTLGWADLFLADTVEQRRRWYLALLEERSL